MPVTVLAEPKTPLVDVVAVHDLFGEVAEPQSHDAAKESSFLWLRNIFAYEQNACRVLVFKYNVSSFVTPGHASDDRLFSGASTLISELVTERQGNASRRPLLFLCHGVGGLLVKQALILSSSQKAKAQTHVRAIYVSTYAIIFAGTPHHGIRGEALGLLYNSNAVHPSQFIIDLLNGSEFLIDIHDRFILLAKQLHICNIWEQVETQRGDYKSYVVDKASAAPDLFPGEQWGMFIDHEGLLEFHDPNDGRFQHFLESLTRYIEACPQEIALRWKTEQGTQQLATRNFSHHNEGHIFHGNTIQGGRVHFGNVYFYNNDRDEGANRLQHQSTADQIKPTSAPLLNELYMVPRSSTPQFTGRQLQAEMLKEELGAIQSPNVVNKLRIAVIQGLGGSGKTQFCLKFAEVNRSSYWGVFWIDASTRENAEAGYASLGQALGRGATFPAGKHWLSQCDRSWLLVIDNADDPELDISEVLPIKGAGHILITTRNPNVVERATAGIFRFRGMDPEEGISLLLKSAFPSEQADASKPEKRRLASSIAAELGYLAIALDQAGATIRRKIYTLERYLHFYLGHRHRLLQSPKSVSPVETNVIATWEIPFKRIENHVSIEHHDAVDLLHVFAFLHFESIPERMFRIFWTSVICDESNNVLLPEILRLDSSRLEEAQTRFRRAAGILYDYSVIEYDPDQGLCSLHPVVHRWARSRLPDDTKILHWLECTLCILTGCISPYLETSGRSFRRSLLPHIESCFLILESYGLSSPQNQQRAKQMERFASVYAENGLWKPAIKLAQAVVRYRVKSLGKSNNETLRAQRSISQFYWNLFEVKSTIDIQKQILFTRWWSRPSLSAWSLPFKPEYDSYLIALDDLTQSLWLAGARDWSKKTGERAVNGFFKQLGPEDPRTLNAMFNLGRTYCHLGEFEKGHELLVMVLKKRKRFFGIDHPDTLMTRNELGMSFCARKQRLAIAERLVVNVLEARKRVLGEEHAYTLWSINDWSKVLCERGRPLQAAKLLEDLIPVVVRTLGEKHIGMTMTKANLARAYVLCEKWADAESILRVILSTVSDDHPDWIHTLSGLVHVQINLGRWDEAEKNCDQMLDHIKIKKTLEVDNPRTIAIAEQLARVYASTGRLDRVPALKAQFPAMDTEDFKRSFAILPSRSKPEVRS